RQRWEPSPLGHHRSLCTGLCSCVSLLLAQPENRGLGEISTGALVGQLQQEPRFDLAVATRRCPFAVGSDDSHGLPHQQTAVRAVELRLAGEVLQCGGEPRRPGLYLRLAGGLVLWLRRTTNPLWPGCCRHLVRWCLSG